MAQRTVVAVINRDVFNHFKKGLPDVHFLPLLAQEGVVLEYQTFLGYLRNTKTWRLTDAMVICKILNVPIDHLFELIDIET